MRAIKNCTCQKLRQDKSRQQFSISLNVGELCAHRNSEKRKRGKNDKMKCERKNQQTNKVTAVAMTAATTSAVQS